jgi:hypothetical protein
MHKKLAVGMIIVLLLATLITSPICAIKVSNVKTAKYLEKQNKIVEVRFRVHRIDGSLVEVKRKMQSSKFRSLIDQFKKALYEQDIDKFVDLVNQNTIKNSLDKNEIEILLSNQSKIEDMKISELKLLVYKCVSKVKNPLARELLRVKINSFFDEIEKTGITSEKTLGDARRMLADLDEEGFGFSVFSFMMIFGGGITIPPIGVFWPALLWFAQDSLGGAKCLFAELGYVVYGSHFGIALPFVGLEATAPYEGELVFAIYGFTLFTMAIGEHVTQIP